MSDPAGAIKLTRVGPAARASSKPPGVTSRLVKYVCASNSKSLETSAIRGFESPWGGMM